MRARALTLAVALAIAACGGGPVQQPAAPDEVVAAWLAALDGSGDVGQFVVPDQISLLAALGRGGAAEAMIAEGLSAESEADFWASFASGVEETAGASISDIDIIGVVVLPVDDVEYAFVRVSGPGGETTVVVRGTADGLVDMVATTGPKLVRPLTTLIEALPHGVVDGPALAASLRAGLSDPGLELPPQFYGEVMDLIVLVDEP